ncbi:jg26778, partial [Pararge aegeria aegeria]
NTQDFKALRHAMTTIELSTCVVFQEVVLDDVLLPKNFIWFDGIGEEMPRFGFVAGKQTIKLSSMITGTPGHTAHTINNLLRILAIPMMSNRYDRDNYVVINWSNVDMGKEQYLERYPEEAWIVQLPYDFGSVTHAPANYMCGNCDLGGATVQPIQV